MIFVWIGGPQLGIDTGSAILALLILFLLIVSAVAAIRREHLITALASMSVVLGSICFMYRTLVTPSGSWPVMYAAVLEKSGAERAERIAELMPLWYFGQVRQIDWYFLSRRWDVCHRMWEQPGCRMPNGRIEPEGLVREYIFDLGKARQ